VPGISPRLSIYRSDMVAVTAKGPPGQRFSSRNPALARGNILLVEDA
jgi:hypothetical protein